MSSAILILLVILDAVYVHDRVFSKTKDHPDSLETTTAIGLIMAVEMVLATVLTWLIYNIVLLPLDIEFLEILIFLLVIAGLMYLTELYLKKRRPAFFTILGNTLPLLSSNCAVLGVALQNITQELSFVSSLLYGLACSAGFLVIMVVLPGLFDRMDVAPISESFRGLPIALLTAGIMYIAFTGLAGVIS